MSYKEIMESEEKYKLSSCWEMEDLQKAGIYGYVAVDPNGNYWFVADETEDQIWVVNYDDDED